MGKFKIKISSSWFSVDFIELRYTTNGIFWKSIKEYHYDVLDKWCYMSIKTSRFDNAKDLLEKFNTLEKVNQYEAEQRDKVIKHNTEISERNRKHNENRKNVYKQFG